MPTSDLIVFPQGLRGGCILVRWHEHRFGIDGSCNLRRRCGRLMSGIVFRRTLPVSPSAVATSLSPNHIPAGVAEGRAFPF